MTISLITATPDENNPSTIAAQIDLFISELKVSIPQMNTDIAGTNTNATTATTQAGIATTQAGISTAQAVISAAEADAAAAAALTALNAPGTSCTSATSLVWGTTGSKVFTTQSGKLWVPGQWVNVANTAAPSTDYGAGIITSYSGTTLTVDMQSVLGSGTIADWTISLSAQAVPLSAGKLYFYGQL